MRPEHAEVYTLLAWWREAIDDVPISVKFDVAALRARELVREKRLAGLQHELGVGRDAAEVLLRFGGLEEVVVPDDVREAAAPTAALAWIADDSH